MYHELENGHPKPAAIREAIALLDKLPAEFQINMYELDAHPCGTIACVGGAYAIARGIDSEVSYQTGTVWLAQDLGFVGDPLPHTILAVLSHDHLVDWAHKNPSLWGNEHGVNMFKQSVAYGVSENDDLTLDQVKRHWLGVSNRIEALG